MKQLNTTAELSQYVRGVAWRIEHHAANLNSVWLVVLGSILRHADAPPTVGTRLGMVTPGAWVHFGGERYAVGAERLQQHQYDIVVRERSNRGTEVARFTDQTSYEAIEGFFKSLKAAHAEKVA